MGTRKETRNRPSGGRCDDVEQCRAAQNPRSFCPGTSVRKGAGQAQHVYHRQHAYARKRLASTPNGSAAGQTVVDCAVACNANQVVQREHCGMIECSVQSALSNHLLLSWQIIYWRGIMAGIALFSIFLAVIINEMCTSGEYIYRFTCSLRLATAWR